MVRKKRLARHWIDALTRLVSSSGQQKRGALIAFGGFYLFGIPLAVYLMFYTRLDIYGFWLGIIAAETVTNTLLFILVHRFNWERHAKAALVRIHFDPNSARADIGTISTADEKSPPAVNTHLRHEDDNETSWLQLLRTKSLILFLLICLLIVGIVTSNVIPLYP